MRAGTAVGLFLLVTGIVILTLHPVYDAGSAPQAGVEATGPLRVYLPMPPWLGLTAMAAGAALLYRAWRRRR